LLWGGSKVTGAGQKLPGTVKSPRGGSNPTGALKTSNLQEKIKSLFWKPVFTVCRHLRGSFSYDLLFSTIISLVTELHKITEGQTLSGTKDAERSGAGNLTAFKMA
jgi:hypothetical protein